MLGDDDRISYDPYAADVECETFFKCEMINNAVLVCPAALGQGAFIPAVVKAKLALDLLDFTQIRKCSLH